VGFTAATELPQLHISKEDMVVIKSLFPSHKSRKAAIYEFVTLLDENLKA